MYEIDDYHEQSDLEHEITLEDNVYPKTAAPEVNNESPQEIGLKRQLQDTALERIGDAARNIKGFYDLIDNMDRLDANRERRERYHEVSRGDNVPLDYNTAEDGQMFPYYLSKAIWRQIQKGDFIDAIFNCPYELHELVTERYIADILKTLSEDNKEILYYIALRRYSTSKIAAIRGQTDRNIRKVRNTMLKRIRKKLYAALVGRKRITADERKFLSGYVDKVNSGR